MQVGQRLGVGQPCSFWHKALDELKHPVGPVDKALEYLMRVDAAPVDAALVEEGLCPRRLFCRRQEYKREVVGGLEMGAFFLELGCPFGIDQRGNRIRELASRI